MEKVLVIGATGFVGKYIARGLLAEGKSVRCLVRNLERAKDLTDLGCEVVQGDMLVSSTVQQALDGVQAVYITVHTLSPQQSSNGQSFVDIEMNGMQNIVAGCKMHNVHRLIYITFLGMSEHSQGAWTQGRWRIEQFLFKSGLDVTIIRPGQIVGRGGFGFNMVLSQAKSRVTMIIGSGKQKWQSIAIDDLTYYLLGVLDDSRTYGQAYEVGSDDILTRNQVVDVAAEVLGKAHPIKIHIPAKLLSVFAPLIERISKFPSGAMKAITEESDADLVGNTTPIRAILPRTLLSYRQAVEQAVKQS